MKDPRYEYEKSDHREKGKEDFGDFLREFSTLSQPGKAPVKAPAEAVKEVPSPPAKIREYELEQSIPKDEAGRQVKDFTPRARQSEEPDPASLTSGAQSPQGLPYKDITLKKVERIRSIEPIVQAVVQPISLTPPASEVLSARDISRQCGNETSLHSLFMNMIEYCASDLHLTGGASPVFRVNGDILVSRLPILSNNDLETILLPILSEEQAIEFRENGELDFAIEVRAVARFRINFFMQHRGISAVFRLIPLSPLEFNDLGLPRIVKDIAEFNRGLVIVTGPTGSGKTTTLAAMLHYINKHKKSHIVTIEDPLEFVHRSNMSLITHREVGIHAYSFAGALKAAIREDPDVILVGEMRDLETMDLAIKAAEMGFLVLTTLHTTNAASSVDRILDTFPIKQQEQIRLVLSQTLKAVVAQQLVKKRDLDGRCPAVEILLGTKALSSLIREGKTHQISSIIQTGADLGMQSMDQSLLELVKNGAIKKDSVRNKISDLKLFERAGIFFK